MLLADNKTYPVHKEVVKEVEYDEVDTRTEPSHKELFKIFSYPINDQPPLNDRRKH